MPEDNGSGPSTAQSSRLVVDTDAHYYENPRLFGKFLDEPWRTRLERWSGLYYAPIAAASRTHDVLVGGRMKRKDLGLPVTDCRDGVLEIMKYLGTDVSVLLPGLLLGIAEISDKRRAVALCHGFIEHMLAETVDPAQGIYTLIVACNQSPSDAATLIDRHASHEGVCGVGMMTDAPFLPFGDSYYDPIYEACVRNHLPLVLHSGYGGPEGHESGYGLQSYVENHIAFVFNNMRQMTSIIFQGVPERFPELKLVFQEAGVFWIPQMMFRLDSEYSMRRPEVPWLKKPPSEYMKSFYYGTQPLERVPNEKYLKYVFEMIDAERTLLFATDWPHSDFDAPMVIERMSFLSEAGKDRILGGNARSVLRFAGKGALPPPQPAAPLAEARV
ncbi:MAG TPA: amidohydrolase family protein [Terriglobia bacterium]|nr:amidohydrolase family protein [Terriglobia bacterium]